MSIYLGGFSPIDFARLIERQVNVMSASEPGIREIGTLIAKKVLQAIGMPSDAFRVLVEL